MREIALRDTTGRQTDRSASRGRPRRGAESACVLAMLALCLCCSMGCREQREPEIDAAVTTTANGLDAVNALRSAVRARDEGRFSRSVDRCAAELGTREIIEAIAELRGSGPFAYASVKMHTEDGLLEALVRQGDQAVVELFEEARADARLRPPAARLLYTLLRGDEPGPDLDRFIESQDELGAQLRAARTKASQFRHDLREPALGELQAIFDFMLGPQPVAIEEETGERRLSWAESPYNPENWSVRALSDSADEHGAEQLCDRRVATFWAPVAGTQEPTIEIDFPESVLLEHEVAYGLIVLPGAKTSEAAFREWGRPTRMRIDFSDGSSKSFQIDYAAGRPRGRVDLESDTAQPGDRELLQTRGPALIVKPGLRWPRWVTGLRLVVESWEPGNIYPQPAVSEFAIGPPAVVPLQASEDVPSTPVRLR